VRGDIQRDTSNRARYRSIQPLFRFQNGTANGLSLVAPVLRRDQIGNRPHGFFRKAEAARLGVLFFALYGSVPRFMAVAA
jgi:hypothetical protein